MTPLKTVARQLSFVTTVAAARPVIGSWVVDGEAVGMGIREAGLITGNTARFTPHMITG
jgi:glutathionylspermidine synthase